MQKRRNSSASAMELHLFCLKPSKYISTDRCDVPEGDKLIMMVMIMEGVGVGPGGGGVGWGVTTAAHGLA